MQFSPDTKRAAITIQGVEFSLPQPFEQGHPCTANEAAALNQLLAENTRNNFAPRIRKAREAYAEANNMNEDDVTAEHLDVAALEKEFDEYVAEYEFGVRRVGSGAVGLTPLEKEARKIAWDKVKETLQAKGIKLNTVSAEKREEWVSGLAAREDVKSLAKKRLDALKKVALEEIDLDVAQAA